MLRVPSSWLQLLLLRPIHQACWISSFCQLAWRPCALFHLSILHNQSWRLRVGSLRLRGTASRHQAALLVVEEGKKTTRKGRRIIRILKNPVHLPLFPSVGLQFWLCVGTRKQGPKCLKPITCCLCLGVTSRCVALIYVAGWDTALISLRMSLLCFHYLSSHFYNPAVFVDILGIRCMPYCKKRYISINCVSGGIMIFCGSGSILSPLQSCMSVLVCVLVYAHASVCHKQVLLQCVGLHVLSNTLFVPSYFAHTF